MLPLYELLCHCACLAFLEWFEDARIISHYFLHDLPYSQGENLKIIIRASKDHAK